MILAALAALAVTQPAVPAASDPATTVQLPATYVTGVQACLANVPKPSGAIYAALAELGRGAEADAKLERQTTAWAGKYRDCLTDLKNGVDGVAPRSAFQRRQLELTRADLDRRLADVAAPFRAMLKFSRYEFAEQPARYWAKLSLNYDIDWLAYEPKPIPSLADKCGTFDSGRVRLFPNDAARTNAVLKRMYAYRDCVDTYVDAADELVHMIDQRLKTANRVAFYAPYVCGAAPAGHCVDRERWQAVAAKLPPDRTARLKAMAARAEPQSTVADRVKDEMEQYVERAEGYVARKNAETR